MTDKELSEILHQQISLSNIPQKITDYGFYKNIILNNILIPLYSTHINKIYINGTEKIVVEFKNYDFLIKIPTHPNVNVLTETLYYRFFKEINHPLQNLFLSSDLFFGENKINFFKQKKIILLKNCEPEDNDIFNKIEEEYKVLYHFLNEKHSKNYLKKWFKDFYEYYGEKTFYDFLNFLDLKSHNLGILDLSITNIGYLNNKQPVIIDGV